MHELEKTTTNKQQKQQRTNKQNVEYWFFFSILATTGKINLQGENQSFPIAKISSGRTQKLAKPQN